MSLQHDRDADGPFLQWGNPGKKLYYESDNEDSRIAAEKAAEFHDRKKRASGYEHKPMLTSYEQPPPPPQTS